MVLGIVPGIVYDILQRHNRLGPRIVILVGGIIHFLGYLGLWAAASHSINQPPYWVVVGFGVAAMNGAVWTDVACVSANVRNFPMDRGTAIGTSCHLLSLYNFNLADVDIQSHRAKQPELEFEPN